jgi:hypothetical protein
MKDNVHLVNKELERRIQEMERKLEGVEEMRKEARRSIRLIMAGFWSRMRGIPCMRLCCWERGAGYMYSINHWSWSL